MTSTLRYREHVVGACCYLNMVDGKSIDARSRIMMVNLHKMRLRTDSSNSSSSNSQNSETEKYNSETEKSEKEEISDNIVKETPDINDVSTGEELESESVCTQNDENEGEDDEDEYEGDEGDDESEEEEETNGGISASDRNFKNER